MPRRCVMAHSLPAGQAVQLVAPPSANVPFSHETGGTTGDGQAQPAAQRSQREGRAGTK